MLEFHEKRKLQRFLQSPLFVGVLVVLTLMLGRSAYKAYETEQTMYTHRVDLEKKLAVLQQERVELESNVGRMADPHGIEEELRKRYSVGREGEEVIILVEEKGEEPRSVPAQPEQEPSVWTQVKNWF